MEQRYISKELTHLVGRRLTEEARYSLLVNKILKPGKLKAQKIIPRGNTTIGALSMFINYNRKFSEGRMYTAYVVCFCDIPIDDLSIHMNKYGNFGLSFAKSFFIEKGASPVGYIANGSVVKEFHTGKAVSRRDCFDELSRRYGKLLLKALKKRHELEEIEQRSGLSKQESELINVLLEALKISTFFEHMIFSFCKPVDEIEDELHKDNYYMEREWRIWGELDFELSDVYRVILPLSYIERSKRRDAELQWIYYSF